MEKNREGVVTVTNMEKILGREHKCDCCGKGFILRPNWSFKRGGSDNKKLFCSWSCMRKWEKSRPTKAEQRAKLIELIMQGKSAAEIVKTENVDYRSVWYWKHKIEKEAQEKRDGEPKMNMKQSLKAAATHIEELTHSNARYRNDVIAYNECITAMIEGKSPCTWCEDHEECQLQAKDGIGCTDWMLAMKYGEVKHDGRGNQEYVPQGILTAGDIRGEGDPGDQSADSTLSGSGAVDHSI